MKINNAIKKIKTPKSLCQNCLHKRILDIDNKEDRFYIEKGYRFYCDEMDENKHFPEQQCEFYQHISEIFNN